MDDNTFLYGRVKFLTEENAKLTEMLERQQDTIGGILDTLAVMQSDEYAQNIVRKAEQKEREVKIKAMQDAFNKRK